MLINIDDVADLEDRSALAAHLADKAAECDGIGLDEPDGAEQREHHLVAVRKSVDPAAAITQRNRHRYTQRPS